MQFIDICAGTGGFRLGLEQCGHECVAWSENDVDAIESYEAMHDTKGEVFWDDITSVSNDDFRFFRGKADIICAGFPCQPFSVAGKKLGFEDERGNIFEHIIRAAHEIQPRYIFLENVKGLFGHDEGRTFRTIIRRITELGFNLEWQILNSKNFGLAQNRERLYLVAHNRRHGTEPIFPICGATTGVLKSIQADTSGKGYKSQQDRFYHVDGIMCTLPKARAKTKCCTVDNEGNFRILTAKERLLLQGFPIDKIEKALKKCSEVNLCERAGNSVSVPVIKAIAEKFI